MVPTMGALHQGHLALMREGLILADHVIATLFVNPKQFGANEDFTTYPRQENNDISLLKATGVSLLYAPHLDEIYPPNFATTVHVSGMSEILCGSHRLGHFDGVATIVSKLLLQVQPDMAIFGEKDYQQLQIIRRVVKDLNIDVNVIGHPIIRDDDGLALSSRNAYLSDSERQIAPELYKILCQLKEKIKNGDDFTHYQRWGIEAILQSGFRQVDYLSLCDSEDLSFQNRVTKSCRLLVAAHLGHTRLLDNLEILPD
jgi:pantoate--beta-alanine ligase